MALTKSQIFTSIGTNLPDNTSGAITPAKLREVLTQIADAPSALLVISRLEPVPSP